MKEKFITIKKSIVRLEKMMNVECKKYLERTLKEHDGRIDFADENGTLDDRPCVTYDGGRHPEYNTNAFSSVYAVFLKDGDIMLETEDDFEYSISRIDWDEVYCVAEYVYYLLK